jgi:hypothetical protein
MSEISTYPLRLPKSLKSQLARIAKREGISVNQLITLAVAEKVSALETGRFFLERAREADLEAFRKLLVRPGGQPPASGDELD